MILVHDACFQKSQNQQALVWYQSQWCPFPHGQSLVRQPPLLLALPSWQHLPPSF